MREIPLTQGKVALVDDEDYEEVSRYRWHAIQKHGRWYARTHVRLGFRRYSKLYLHTLILGEPPIKHEIDHRDGDGLNDQRQNLRYATRPQNIRNGRRHTDSTTGFKGVSQARKKWRARIFFDGKEEVIGYFNTPEEAAQAYAVRAGEIFGEFARPSFSTN